MFCKNCGKELADVAKFCDGCGSPVVAEQQAPAAPEQPAPAASEGQENKVIFVLAYILFSFPLSLARTQKSEDFTQIRGCCC